MIDRDGRRRWVIFACRSDYTTEVAEIIWRRGEDIFALVDNLSDADTAHSVLGPTVSPGSLVAERHAPVVIPLITPGFRQTVATEARGLGHDHFPALIDPTAVVARTSSIGEGSVVNCGVIVGASSRVGQFVHLNRGASVGHDADLGDFTTLGPSCVLAGKVTVEPGAFVGAGAVCAPGVRVGANSIVGAGAVVVRDVPSGAVVVGNPAKVVRIGEEGYGGAVVRS